MDNQYNIRWFDVTDSTNNQLIFDKNLLEDKCVYAALFQTAGKGQRGNHWESRSGENLTFSILFRPTSIASNQQFTISEAVALGVVDYLRLKGISAKIKWPNDIYIGDKKICGILIENTISNDKLTYSVAGIGLNLNQKHFDSDAPNPTSLALESGLSFSPKEELPILLSCIFAHYEQLQSIKFDLLEKRYTSQLYRLNEFHTYIQLSDNKEIVAKIIGIDKTARLLLETSDGSVLPFAFKEIKYCLAL